MPLFKGKSKKDIGKNIEIEEAAGKPHKQSLAIALNVSRRAVKKAKGGMIMDQPDSAVTESSAIDADSITPEEMNMIHRHRTMMAAGGEVTAKTERRASADDRDMEMEHGTEHAEGQELDARDEDESMDSADHVSSRSQKMMRDTRKTAPEKEDSAYDDSMSGSSADAARTKRNMRMLADRSTKHESELDARDEGHSDEDEMHERSQSMLRQKGQPDSYSKTGRINYAKGGEVEEDDMTNMEHDEDDNMSLAQAIRHRRAKPDADMADVTRNADEDLNNEEQMNYKAGRRQNYAEEQGLDDLDYTAKSIGDDDVGNDEDKMDMVSSIRKRMKSK
jgi:hypothetical protein